MQCEKCGSSQTRTLEAIYLDIQEEDFNIVYSGNDRGGGWGKAWGRIMTGAQHQATPPEKKRPILWVLVTALLLYWMLYWEPILMPLAVLLAVVTATRAYDGYQYNREKWPEEYDCWTRSWYCTACAHISVEPIVGKPIGTGTRKIGDTLGAIDEGEVISSSRTWVISGFDLSGRPIRFVFDSTTRLGDTILIGRISTECEFLIDDPSVSRRHAEISIRNEGVFISDLSSTNGTWINGQRVSGAAIQLPPNGTVSVGAITLRFIRS